MNPALFISIAFYLVKVGTISEPLLSYEHHVMPIGITLLKFFYA
jgi:hypothetical protein